MQAAPLACGPASPCAAAATAAARPCLGVDDQVAAVVQVGQACSVGHALEGYVAATARGPALQLLNLLVAEEQAAAAAHRRRCRPQRGLHRCGDVVI